MDELERRMRDGMNAAVEGWSPTPSEVGRTAPSPTHRRLQVGLAMAAVVLLVAGGVGIAFGVTGSHGSPKPAVLAAETPSASPPPSGLPTCPGLQFLSEGQYDEEFGTATSSPGDLAASGCPEVIRECPSAQASAAYQPLTSVTNGAYASSVCTSPPTPDGSEPVTMSPSPAPAAVPVTASAAVATATPSLTPTPSATPSASQTAALPTCTADDLGLAVSTDKATYVQTSVVHIIASIDVTTTCTISGDGPSIFESTAAGAFVAGNCGTPQWEHSCPAVPPLKDVVMKQGTHSSETSTWDMVAKPASGSTPTVWASAGEDGQYNQANPPHADYAVHYTYGSLDATAKVRVAPPPSCTPAELDLDFATDKPSYSQGETAVITGSATSAATSVCSIDPSIGYPPLAADASGTTVWSSGKSSGQDYPPPVYSTPARFRFELPVLPGQRLPHYDSTGTLTSAPWTWSWALAADGTQAQPKAAPVTDGTYTLAWAGGPFEAPVKGAATEPVGEVTIAITG